MTLSDFQFDLPPELIAQVPAEYRDQARLLVLDRTTGALTHSHVPALPDHLRPGDLLVVNDTRVIPARLFGRTASGGAVEVLLIRPTGGTAQDSTHRAERASRASARGDDDFIQSQQKPSVHPEGLEGCSLRQPTSPEHWLCLGKPAKRLRTGTQLTFPDNVRATVTGGQGNGHYTIAFDDAAAVPALIARHGEIPLPPYIRRPDGPLPLDQTRYQTIFATTPGAIAAPTAGLHFTEALVAGLRARGIQLAPLTLHVGPGTFLPVRCEDFRQHVMESEWCDIPAATVATIQRVKATGGRVVAVGTTTTRALESAASDDGVVRPGARWADQFIVPGYQFRIVDALFTNFHLPGSTLLLLVSAFAGRERILATYAEAVRRRYRFYSYDDAMLIE